MNLGFVPEGMPPWRDTWERTGGGPWKKKWGKKNQAVVTGAVEVAQGPGKNRGKMLWRGR